MKELRRRSHLSLSTKGLLDKLAGLDTFASSKAFSFDFALALGVDDDFNAFAHAAPPTLTVNLIEPLSSLCSVTV